MFLRIVLSFRSIIIALKIVKTGQLPNFSGSSFLYAGLRRKRINDGSGKPEGIFTQRE